MNMNMDPESYVMTTGRLPNAPGIYIITHRGNGRVYIGSSVNMRRRWRNHCSSLRKGDHRSPYLQHSWNKYGAAYFSVRCIERVPTGKLREREQLWMDGFDCTDPQFGYNTLPAAYSGLGARHSPETKAKMSLSRRRGRLHLGEANGRAVLTEEAVLAMRRLYSDGMLCIDLAKLFGVCPGSAHRAVTGCHWKHLPGAIKKPRQVLTEEAVLAMRRLAVDGMPCSELGRLFKVHCETARKAVTCKTWKQVA